MMQPDRRPPVGDLVLVGGGHSHIEVLRALGMAPLESVRVTVLAREAHTPYSGMLPGYVAGHYRWEDLHIDLGPLCRLAGARLIVDEVTGLDLQRNVVHCANRPPVRFDTLSINCGAVPRAFGEVGVPVKPIGRFLPQWRAVREQAKPGARILFVGGGAGGVELALAARKALPGDMEMDVVTSALLPDHGRGAQRLLRDELAKARIGLRLAKVTAATDDALTLEDGCTLAFDRLFWVTGVQAPEWLRASGLATDAGGFARVDTHLRSLSHPHVFAAGDAASLEEQPRPKSGVFAVRAGPILATNLRRRVEGRPTKRFRAQRRFLSLIGTGDGRAVASRSGVALRGRWAWRWKEWIDRRFMAKYQMPPNRVDPSAGESANAPASAIDQPTFDPMRCGGCGAKLASAPLRRVLDRLPEQNHPDVVQGIGDDAAILRGHKESLLLTVDGFRSLIDDPYRFGRITAHHSLNDIYAMGARPTSALALATIPLMAEALMEEELYDLLKGAVDVLNVDGVPLVGGHSAEGSELSLGLAITGKAQEPLLSKGGGKPGDRLLLTKPLGSGVLFAAHMRGLATTGSVQLAIECMDQSNQRAIDILRAHGARACTDVTGFGLVGHLGEMLRGADVGAEIRLESIPHLAGALQSFERGASSVLQAGNSLALADFTLRDVASDDPRVQLLADPQTAGGLLACVPEERALDCVGALRGAGYSACADIGCITSGLTVVRGGGVTAT